MFCVVDALRRPCPRREISVFTAHHVSLRLFSSHAVSMGSGSLVEGNLPSRDLVTVVASASRNKTKPSCLGLRYKAHQEVLIVHRPILLGALDASLVGDVLALGRDLLPGEAIERTR